MKVLLITNTTTEAGFGDWQNTLKREGVPFDTLVTSTTPALPTLSVTNGTTGEAKYAAVIVATGGLEGLTSAQWATLQTYEQQFNVRQVTAYASGNSTYGLTSPNPAGGGVLDGQSATLTTDGKTIFPYLNGTVKFDTGTFGYESTPVPATGETFATLLTGAQQLVPACGLHHRRRTPDHGADRRLEPVHAAVRAAAPRRAGLGHPRHLLWRSAQLPDRPHRRRAYRR